MSHTVVEFLRELDLSSVDLSAISQFTASSASTREEARRHRQVAAAVASVLPSTAPLSNMSRLQSLRLSDAGLSGDRLPVELSKLRNLETLCLSRNQLTHLSALSNWPSLFPNLRVINCRKNCLTEDGSASPSPIPPDLFECPHLQIVDLSRNKLSVVPKGLANATGLLVLNLSDNRLTSMPPEVLSSFSELMLLDLSGNQLDSISSQLRRCSSLQQLLLSRNPLSASHLRAIAALKHLEVLHLAATERRLDNFPCEFDRLVKLVDLDLSENLLLRIPEPVFQLCNLRKLNLSHNDISELSGITGNWPVLEYLNLSYNKLESLPSGITNLNKLRKLYVNGNQLTFDGLPKGISKLTDLEIFNASENRLKNIPEGLCRCGRLKRLILSNNQLVTLPNAIHYVIETLDVFDVENNPKLELPPKPPELQKGAGLAFYNIDFSLDAQLKLCRGQRPEPSEAVRQAKAKDARLRRLRRRLNVSGTEVEGNVVLAGMRHIANRKDAQQLRRNAAAEEEAKQLAAKRWQDALKKPNLDYTQIFDQNVGTISGLEMWEIDEFYPKPVLDDPLSGHLFDGDCYILLETKVADGTSLDWRIFYWIGAKATLDKRACAAMHAVNLRNLLGAECQTLREEQSEESEEMLRLFDGRIIVAEGCNGYTGFYHVKQQEVPVKLYRLFGQEKQMRIVSMPVSPLSLDPKYVYLLDGESRLYLWEGSKSRQMIQSKGHLLAEKIVSKERLSEAEIRVEPEGHESDEFFAILMKRWRPPPLLNSNLVVSELSMHHNPTETPAAKRALEEEHRAQKQKLLDTYPKPPQISDRPPPARNFIPLDWKLPKPIVYEVKYGKGYLELPQIDLPQGNLTKDLLKPKNVYLVDSGGELFVWMGENSRKVPRTAGYKLALELIDLMPRGCFGGAESSVIENIVAGDNTLSTDERPVPQVCPQGAESQIFRVQFPGWEPAMAVDFTRTAESIARRGVDMDAIMEKDKMKTDLRALLNHRELPISRDDAMQTIDDLNQELIDPPTLESYAADGTPSTALQQFIIIDRKWVPVEQRWFGHFFSQDCYLVIARYWEFDDEELDEQEDEETASSPTAADASGTNARERGEFVESDEEDRTRSVVYFWQGREASDLTWLTFNFSVLKDMTAQLSRNDAGRPYQVEFKRMRQQQEDTYFLSHFLRRMTIHNGRFCDRNQVNERVQMYHLRMNGNPICTRLVEVKPNPLVLNSAFSYIVRIPAVHLRDVISAPDNDRDLVFIWLGDKSDSSDEALLESITDKLYSKLEAEVLTISEGGESAAFWTAVGGKKQYDKQADYMNYARLFRLSNEMGYFHASEKCADFCQDDLINEDVMMLDTGDQIYLWLGRKTSDVEVKLSLQSARLYKERMLREQPNRLRQLKLTAKNAEPHHFRRCFHGWGAFREPKDWSG